MSSRNQRRHRTRRARSVVALAAIAFVLGAVLGSAHGSSARVQVAESFTRAWARGEYLAMYERIDTAAQRATSPSAFADTYREAARTATASAMSVVGTPRARSNGTVVVPVRVHTRLWGTLAESFTLPIEEGADGARVAWSRSLEFPGLRAGETLSRQTQLPPRAAILADDGSVLAEGAASAAGTRASPLGAAAAGVVGEVGPIPATRRAQLESEGVPANAIVGVSGLELALDPQLRGTPGGELLAGERVLASATARAGSPVRTTISPALQRVAAAALGEQLGGVVALNPSSGAILAVAGLGIDDLQPPGSTFKMVTLSAVLEAGIARDTTVFPYATYTTLDGVKLENANGESCGGSLALAFAVSCNSVFAPLGVKVGAPRLVATAEAFGFNHPPGVAGAVESTLPPAGQIQGELALGSTAIGQDQVQASALQMATVAATIADAGRRPTPTFQPPTAPAPGPRAIAASTAHVVRELMIGVVREGTGTAAAIPGVVVAGKTGTAELGLPSCAGSGGEHAGEAGEESEHSAASGHEDENCSTGSTDPQNTDAWFAAFAPALNPQIVVGVMLVKDGAGGEAAAPVARQVIEAALGR